MTIKDFGVERRVAKDFDNIIREIQKKKIENGTADIRKRKTFSSRRITLAMTRHKIFQEVVIPDIIKSDLN